VRPHLNLLETPRRVRYIPDSPAGPETRRQRAARFCLNAVWFGLILEGNLVFGLIGSVETGRILFAGLALLLNLIFVACLVALFLRCVVFPGPGLFKSRLLRPPASHEFVL
jgi:hypothetical protein